MADNSTMGGTTDSIRDKDRSGVKTQIFGLDVGIGGGTEVLMSSANPMPVTSVDMVATGTLSAPDTVLGVHAGAGVLLTGTPTANSNVALWVGNGESAFVVQLTGTFGGGTVWFECSADSTNGIDGRWSTLTMRVMGTVGSTVADSCTVAGLFRGNTAGMTYVRVRVTGGTTPSIAAVIRATEAAGPVALNAAIPSGTSLIGYVGAGPSTTGTITSAALALTSFTLLAANANRKTATVYNDSNNSLYVALATTATVTAFTVLVPPGGYYELPGTNVIYNGQVSGIALVATGNARVTELT